MSAFYNGSERTDYAEFQEDTQADRFTTKPDADGEFAGPDTTPVESDEEGFARVNGKQEVPDHLRGLASPTDRPIDG